MFEFLNNWYVVLVAFVLVILILVQIFKPKQKENMTNSRFRQLGSGLSTIASYYVGLN